MSQRSISSIIYHRDLDGFNRRGSYDVCLSHWRRLHVVRAALPAASKARTATFDNLVTHPGTDYYFRIYSHNANASTASVRYWFNLPVGTVSNVSMTRQEGTSRVPTRWTAATNAEHYEVQFGTNPSMTTGLKQLHGRPTFSDVYTPDTRHDLPLSRSWHQWRCEGCVGHRTPSSAWPRTPPMSSSSPTTCAARTNASTRAMAWRNGHQSQGSTLDAWRGAQGPTSSQRRNPTTATLNSGQQLPGIRPWRVLQRQVTLLQHLKVCEATFRCHHAQQHRAQICSLGAAAGSKHPHHVHRRGRAPSTVQGQDARPHA